MQDKQKLLEHRRKIKKRKPVFLRTDSLEISSLGKRRKKKQKWRRPKGRHNKLRENRKGHIKPVSIGYSAPRKIRGSINGFMPIIIKNENDVEKIGKEDIGIVAKVGMKKKIAIAKKADKLNAKLNINIKKFLKSVENKLLKKV